MGFWVILYLSHKLLLLSPYEVIDHAFNDDVGETWGAFRNRFGLQMTLTHFLGYTQQRRGAPPAAGAPPVAAAAAVATYNGIVQARRRATRASTRAAVSTR